MLFRTRPMLFIGTLTLLGATSCGGRPGEADLVCDFPDPQCPDGLVCSIMVEGDPFCVAPLTIRGTVLDATTDEPIPGALVQAVDVNGAAVGTSAETDDNGTYTLIVPAVRDIDGMPIEGTYTLRAQAASYQGFPSAIRPALPLDATTADLDEGTWIIEDTLTVVKLLPLLIDTTNLGSISGTVDAESRAGILVIADGDSGAFTGFTNADGAYTIFNVPLGIYSVRGYAGGVQLTPATATLNTDDDLVDIDLLESSDPLGTVSGSVQIVDPSGASATSVVLAVESTFVENAARGEVPPGLRVGEITSGFTINGVPNGRYVVLAAFENDGLVRDPDQTIGGTSIVRITVPDPDTGNIVNLAEGFKVTGALAVVMPGSDGPEELPNPTPVFTWEDDSSEDGYEIRVFDAFGTEIWSKLDIASVSGSETVSHTYAGPGLIPGMFYQFRVTSFRDKNGVRTAISTTEDLKGVFQLSLMP